MSDLSGCKTGKDFKWMEPIFERWIEYNETYLNFHSGDDSHYDPDSLSFYGERPSVGTLAAAAWSIPKGYALQEYYAEKWESQHEEETKSGREDLYLGRCRNHVRLEAKCIWVNAHSELKNGEFDNAFRKCMEEAKDHAKRYIKYDDIRAALVVVNFRSLKAKMNEELIQASIEAVRKVKIKTKAWFFADSEINQDYRYHCFGTALFISSIRLQRG